MSQLSLNKSFDGKGGGHCLLPITLSLKEVLVVDEESSSLLSSDGFFRKLVAPILFVVGEKS